MDIDIVINYVNGNDTAWVEKRNKYAMDTNNPVCRFQDNGELKYLLRSIEKYAPWIRTVYIVADSRMPNWLNLSNPKLRIIRHEDIMPEEILPCYNSNVIEYHLDNIPGLSNIFLYANDDMFFGRKVSKSFFVKNRKPIIRMQGTHVKPENYYDRILCNSQDLMESRYGVHYDLIPTHCIDTCSKKYRKACKNVFSDELEHVYRNRMRSNDDIERVIIYYYMLYKKACYLNEYRGGSNFVSKAFHAIGKILLPSLFNDMLAINIDKFFKSPVSQLYFYRKPRILCINHSEKTTDRHIKQYKALMKKKFPNKSSFEK